MGLFTRSMILTLAGLAASTAANAQRGQPFVPPPPPPPLPNDVFRSDADRNQATIDRLFSERRGETFDARGMKIERAEMNALRELEKKANSPDGEGGAPALAAAKPVIKSPDAVFVMAALQLRLGTKLNDRPMQSEATDLLVASGRAPASALPSLLRNQGVFALEAKNMVKAQTAFRRLIDLKDDHIEGLTTLAYIESGFGNRALAAQLLDRAIMLKEQAGEKVDPSLRRVSASLKQPVAKP